MSRSTSSQRPGPEALAPHLLAGTSAGPSQRARPRTTAITDLSARVLSPGCGVAARRVLNLSASGMLISGDDLDLGTVTRFELIGPRFRSAGTAEVAHRSTQTMGLKFIELDSVSEEDLHDVVIGRLSHSG